MGMKCLIGFIAYELAAPSAVRLEVYDVAGRLVRSLFDGVAQAGRHRIAWDGRSDSGAAAAAGVYCCRLASGEFTAVCHVALVR